MVKVSFNTLRESPGRGKRYLAGDDIGLDDSGVVRISFNGDISALTVSLTRHSRG